MWDCVCVRARLCVCVHARAALACHVWVGVTAHARACEAQGEGGCNLRDPHWPAGGVEGVKGTRECVSVRSAKLGWGRLGPAFLGFRGLLLNSGASREAVPTPSLWRAYWHPTNREHAVPQGAAGLWDRSHGRLPSS